MELVDYVVFVIEVLKEQYFKVQFQQSDDVCQFNVYDLKKNGTFKVHFDRSLKTVVNVKHNRSDGSLYFGSNCYIREAVEGQVNFILNEDLCTKIIESSRSKPVVIKDLLAMDVQKNKTNKFTLKVLITLGDGDYTTIQTSSVSGSGEIKEDIIAEDASGHINLRLFREQVESFSSGKSYELSHMILKKYHAKYYMHTSSESKISQIPDLQLTSVASSLLKNSKVKIEIAEIASVNQSHFTSFALLRDEILCRKGQRPLRMVQVRHNDETHKARKNKIVVPCRG